MKTAIIVSDIIDFPQEKIKYEWRLNERHYGSLQGLNKSETALKYGEDQVQVWRRSFDIAPPLLKLMIVDILNSMRNLKILVKACPLEKA